MRAMAYLDASALVKMAVSEAESPALVSDIRARGQLLSSRLGAAELRRACARSGHRRIRMKVDDVLAHVLLVDVSSAILESAGRLEPPELRTLDAIHLATALSVGAGELDLITYDDRLAMAARNHGLSVVQPV